MSLYLTKFIERLRGAEARGGKDFIMPLAEAKGVGADLTELLLELNQLKESKLAQEEVILVHLSGGKF